LSNHGRNNIVQDQDQGFDLYFVHPSENSSTMSVTPQYQVTIIIMFGLYEDAKCNTLFLLSNYFVEFSVFLYILFE